MRIAVCGGKGGTGKSLIASSVSKALEEKGEVLLVDADVDNPCSKFFFKDSEKILEENLYEFRPVFDQKKCTFCGVCSQKCPEKAIVIVPNRGPVLVPGMCSGCGVCELVCPHKAILAGREVEGTLELFSSGKMKILIGTLKSGSRRTAVLVNSVIRRSHDFDADYVVYDSPPGTGAKLFPILSSSEKALVVSEPTPLGLSDTKKFLEFSLKIVPEVYLIINKEGISPELGSELKSLAKDYGIKYFEIPYSEEVQRAYLEGKSLLELDWGREKVEEILRGAGIL